MVRLLPRVLSSLVKKPFTRKYPKIPAHPPKGFRGKHVYDKEKCIGCGLCVRNCPSAAITFLPNKKVEFHLDKCIFCGRCEEVCPVDAINLSTEIPLGKNQKEQIIK